MGLPFFSLAAKSNSKQGNRSLGFGLEKKQMDHFQQLLLERFLVIIVSVFMDLIFQGLCPCIILKWLDFSHLLITD